MPDAPDLLTTFLEDENDPTCKRNAFAALTSISHEKALEHLSDVFDSIPNHDELLLLSELEFIRKDAATNPQNKPKYLRLIFDLLESQVSTVIYEAAHALTTLTSNPVAVKAAAGKFVELAIKEPDNNVKLIVLERVNQLRYKNEGVIDDLTMEVLRVLSSTDLDVRKKALNIAMDMISSRNVEEVVLLLKKELMKTADEQYDKNSEYRSLLISAIHQSAIKFPEVAASVVGSLMDFISDVSSNASAVDVISFVKEVVERFPDLRQSIIERLVSTLGEVRAGKVYRGVLWIIGEFSLEAKDIRDAWKGIRSSLGEIPILASEQRLLDDASEGKEDSDQVNGHAKSAPTGSRKVLADGTYATESALTSSAAAKAKLEAVKNSQKPPLRQLILDGDYYLATVLSSTLTKLVMRHSELSQDAARTNALRAEAMLIMISIIRVGQSQFVKTLIDEDSIDRIMSCVRSLSEFSQRKELETVFLEDTRKSFATMVQTEEKKRAAKEASDRAKSAVNVDDSFSIRQLKKKDADGSDEIEQDLERATGGDTATEDLTSKLSRVVQLTGFSDPVYAEAYVKVRHVSSVPPAFTNLIRFTNSISCLTSFSSTRRPRHCRTSPSNLRPSATSRLLNARLHKMSARTTSSICSPLLRVIDAHGTRVKLSSGLLLTTTVSSTDTGVIFGNVLYEGYVVSVVSPLTLANGACSEKGVDSNVVILNDVHVDIMDYIKPAQCTETQFRTMWTEFEWENKVNINSKAKTLREFLKQLMACTNMSCLTPEASMKGDCQFLSANLYARSVFGKWKTLPSDNSS
jgi:coatomer subunit beta